MSDEISTDELIKILRIYMLPVFAKRLQAYKDLVDGVKKKLEEHKRWFPNNNQAINEALTAIENFEKGTGNE